MANRYPFVGAAAHLFPKNAIKMLSFSTSGKGSILLYPFRSSPLLAITFLYHPKDFFLYRAAALFEYRESTRDPAGLYFACAPSGKMILFTKKKITMEMPPLSTVVPML